MKIVFATNNLHKLEEIRQILGDKFEVLSLNDIGCHDDIPEDHDTLQENALQKDLQKLLGPSFRVLNRAQQDQSVYRMMRYEKLAIYLILLFIVILVAFNIYSSLKMLVLEKKADCATLRALGAPEPLLRSIFLWEGWLVSLLGMLIGLVAGILLVWLQQRYGLVPMPGNFVVSAYPVVLKVSDLLWTVLGVALTGFVMAYIPSRKV